MLDRLITKPQLVPARHYRVIPKDFRDGLIVELDFRKLTIVDKSGNLNNPTQNGTQRFVPGLGNGNALDFTAVTEYLTFASLTVPTTAFSFVIWVKFDAIDDNARIIDWQKAGPSDGFAFLVDQGTHKPTFVIRNVGTNVASIPANAVVDTWYCFAGTYEVNEAKFFRDGESVGSDTSCTMTDASPTVLTLGKRAPSAANPFNGQIGAFRLYNRKLSTAEVKMIYEMYRRNFGKTL